MMLSQLLHALNDHVQTKQNAQAVKDAGAVGSFLSPTPPDHTVEQLNAELSYT